MDKVIGHKTWSIAKGYVYFSSNGPEKAFAGQGTSCFFGAPDQVTVARGLNLFKCKGRISPSQETVSVYWIQARLEGSKDTESVPRGAENANAVENYRPNLVQCASSRLRAIRKRASWHLGPLVRNIGI